MVFSRFTESVLIIYKIYGIFHVMKKMFLVGIASAVIFAGGFTIFFLTKSADHPPINTVRSVAAKQASPIEESVISPNQSISEQAAPSAYVETPTSLAESIPMENKTKIMVIISDYAQSHRKNVYAQTTCFDKAFTSANIYDDYSSLESFPLLQSYLSGLVYFRSTLCEIVALSTTPSGN